jgi:MraZ protein
MVVPRFWREDLSHGAFLAPSWYGCLWLFTWQKWEQILGKLQGIQLTDAAGDRLNQFLGRGEPVTLDGQGRVLIPALMREHANIDKDIVLAGAITRVEIWSQEKAKDYRQQQFATPQMMEMVEKAKELGI